ncbi:LysR family transcriptional regulator [Pseudonocardia phyllosphaerae]|uniref:LysR family transcriptional regulator n=1 Tax=Pseudonocardia phyllosphaerae TaxID=3390502 RepID=UPI00397876E9
MTTNARLRALVELAETGSVRRAAERLVVTESSVSSSVTALAAEVGAALVVRSGRGVRLTPAGERYAEYARRILGLHAEAVLSARSETDPEHGEVRIGAVTTAGEFLVPQMLASFRDEHPDVVLRLEVAPRGMVWPMLDRHEVDLVVAGRPSEHMTDARVRALSPNELVVVGSPVLRDGFDPARITWLQREPASGMRATCNAVHEQLGITPPQMVLGSNGAVVAAAVAGLGVTLVSRQAVHRELGSGALAEMPVEGLPLSRPWHMVSQPRPTASTRLLIEHVLGVPELGWSAHTGR